MKFVSPTSIIWHKIYRNLLEFWEYHLEERIPQPPAAFILGGWALSNDFEKQQRWNETLLWAKENNCENLIPHLEENEKYYVDEMSDWVPYQFSNWNDEPREKPEADELVTHLDELSKAWSTILDERFGLLTQPIDFTGSKSRRLIVRYRSGYLPPWGSWTNHLAKGSPSKFTELRKKVNSIIEPHEVDHIDFIKEKIQPGK